ncbi:MAG: hypothetical protein WCK29_03285 [archaeon]
MQLSKKAIEDLRVALINDVGLKDTEEFSDEDLDEVGMFLLTSLAEVLKLRMYEKRKK